MKAFQGIRKQQEQARLAFILLSYLVTASRRTPQWKTKPWLKKMQWSSS